MQSMEMSTLASTSRVGAQSKGTNTPWACGASCHGVREASAAMTFIEQFTSVYTAARNS